MTNYQGLESSIVWAVVMCSLGAAVDKSAAFVRLVLKLVSDPNVSYQS